MRKIYFLLILCTLAITIALLLAACAKTGSKGATGPAGPQGPAGLQGTAGAAGAPGTPGAPGSQILTGPTTPSSTTGNLGDYYFDNGTDSLYGPKTSTGWGTAVSLRGSAGATGATGAAGQTGATGATGTANVIYYNWTGFNPLAWGDFDPTYFRRECSINMPSITSQLLDQGVVLVYLEYLLGTSIDPHQLTYKEVCTKYGIQP